METTRDIRFDERFNYRRRMLIVFFMTFGYLIVEVIGGLLTQSLALLADAGHMLTDVGGLAIALFAMWFAERPPTPQKSYGYYRAEILAALVNAVILIFISFYILYEAYRRFIDPPIVLALPMMTVAVVGLIVNLIGMRLLHAGSKESLNLKGAYLEVLSDMLSSVGVIIAALVMLTTGWYLADPIISVGIGLFILPRTWGLLKQAVNILMEATPEHINLEEVGKTMASVEGVKEVHDLHVWTLTSGKYALSAHVTITKLQAWPVIQNMLETLLADRFRIDHTTLQVSAKPGHRIEEIEFPQERG
ncbi:MAG: cation diffusion facilitator family transporter (plasmid) [Candidatus Manganitrophus sp.]|nr:cation diffusion facilitator family transporter [Candidatus Manganitrophus sp.]WDT73444.1 MAG: cation diffusion facilitator family transporter [Candidatus Manganitrophus sp.]WDT77927.1 MAG: cation diffusion facilitator family transporter [Candidatus Manganitrophus sp.]WDT82969.1 MAG: cation diffusion facilitator family transporter [Candidatus Manganitrophus sp.]